MINKKEIVLTPLYPKNYIQSVSIDSSDLRNALELVHFADLYFDENGLLEIQWTNETAAQSERAIYAWFIDEKLVRIGSSKGKLFYRTKQTKGWLNGFYRGNPNRKKDSRYKSNLNDANNWRNALSHSEEKVARCYGRTGQFVETPIGPVNTYLAIENVLIERHKPMLNRSSHR